MEFRGSGAMTSAGPTAVLRLALAGVAALVLALALAAPSQAGVYWTNYGSGGTAGTIGRANPDGSAVQQDFITGAAGPVGVVVSGSYIYWSNPSTQNSSPGTTIGRANLDGTGVNNRFITGALGPHSLAVQGPYLYWDNRLADSIGRANLDGTGVDNNFITGAGGPWGIATDANFVYWTNFGAGGGSGGTTIGRANLNGTGVNESFITGASAPAGIAVNGSHIYWANQGVNSSGTTIGRANLDGTTGVNQSFITGASSPGGIAVDATSVYWSNASPLAGPATNAFGGSTIGRATLDGAGVNQSFITGANSPLGIYTDAAPLVYAPAPVPPAPAPAAPTPAPAKPAAGALPKFASLVTLPSAKACVSRRKFSIRLRVPKGSPVTSAQVKVNGKSAAVRRGARLRSTVNLTQLPKGSFRVDIVLKLSDGRTVKGHRSYRTCAAKRHKHKA